MVLNIDAMDVGIIMARHARRSSVDVDRVLVIALAFLSSILAGIALTVLTGVLPVGVGCG